MKLYVALAAAAALLAVSNAHAAPPRDKVLRAKCIGDRCAVYNRGGERVGSVTTEATGRQAVRDRDGTLRAKLTPVDGGVRVRSWPPRD